MKYDRRSAKVAVRDIEVATEEESEDPVIEALRELERSAREVRKQLKKHDLRVRRETIVTLAESLKEASVR